jgi:hypothetical protein
VPGTSEVPGTWDKKMIWDGEDKHVGNNHGRETRRRTDLPAHCSEELHTVWFRKLAAQFGNRYVYFCSSCKKVLGVSHRKGFWMG